MGGIAFEIPETESKKFLPVYSKQTWFVGYKAIKRLSKYEDGCNVVPNLSIEEINTKSKANGISKALVCTQAVWFIAQCLTRGMQECFFFTSNSGDTRERY